GRRPGQVEHLPRPRDLLPLGVERPRHHLVRHEGRPEIDLRLPGRTAEAGHGRAVEHQLDRGGRSAHRHVDLLLAGCESQEKREKRDLYHVSSPWFLSRLSAPAPPPPPPRVTE